MSLFVCVFEHLEYFGTSQSNWSLLVNMAKKSLGTSLSCYLQSRKLPYYCYAAPAPPGAATILSAGQYGAIIAITAALAWSRASRSLPLPRTGAVRKTTLSAPPGLLLSLSIVFYSSSLFARNTRPLSQAQSPPSASNAPDVPPGKTPLASNPKPHRPVTRFSDPTGITTITNCGIPV